jgi:Tfp pilus assembly protein PilX
VTLIIALIMLVIIGLTAGAAMRSAVSSEKAVNNMRSEVLAQQYAEVGLRYCEEQVKRPSGDRPPTLQDDVIAVTVAPNALRWELPATWAAGGGRTQVPAGEYSNALSSNTPATAPQCFAEKQTLPDGKSAVVITARGFSPDYRGDPVTGNTTAGSVVWLQSVQAFN